MGSTGGLPWECPFPARELNAKAVRKGCLWFLGLRSPKARRHRISLTDCMETPVAGTASDLLKRFP